MSADAMAMPDPEGAAGEPMAAFGATRGATTCRGCGQRPDDLAPHEAVAVTRLLERRSASLLQHREHSLRYRGTEPGAWSALEPAAAVSHVLGAAHSWLCDLLGEEKGERVSVVIEVPEWATPDRSPRAVLASLAENAERLVATIDCATAEDWYRARPGHGATAGDMVWLALHAATHHLEDAELLLDAALARGPVAVPDFDGTRHS